MDNKTIAVTGASGLLGFNFISAVAGKHPVVGFYHRNPIEIEGIKAYPLQILNYQKVKETVNWLKPDIIYHFASISNPNHCEKDPGASYGVNVTGTKNIVAAARSIDAKVVFTSSDLVFDGKNAPYTEKDAPNPLNLYGLQKVEAEQIVLDYQDGKVVRMPLIFGPKSPHSGSFLQPTINFIRSKSKITLFDDEFRTPISTRKAVEGLLLAADLEPALLHLSCDERISRYDMGYYVANHLGLDTDLIIKSSQKEVSFPASRPSDTSLDISLAKSFGFSPGSLYEELKWVIKSL